MNYEFYGYQFEIEDDEVLVRNESSQLSQIWFIKPSTGYAPYSYGNFENSVWVKVKPKNWIDIHDNWKVNIEIIQKDRLILLQYDVDTCELSDRSNKLISVENYEIRPVFFSVIIAAYNTKNYLQDCLNSIIRQQNKYLKLEIVIGVDSCLETLAEIYKMEIADNIKVYYFEENVGKAVVANTLSTLSSGDYLLFFDSDDIAIDGIFDASRYLADNDFVILSSYSFEDGSDHTQSESFSSIGGCSMIQRQRFLSMNGYHRWRCQADDEFIKRCTHQKMRIYKPEEISFYYRIRSDSLSRTKLFNTNSKFRNIYKSIITINQSKQNWPNPKKLHVDRCFKIF